MIEVCAEDVLLVLVDGDVAPKATPKTTSLDGQDILGSTVNSGYEHLATLLLQLFADNLGILGVDGFTTETSDVQRGQDLVLSIALHVGILNGLQNRRNEGQQESHDDNHYGCIDERIDVAVRVYAFRLHFLDFGSVSAADRALVGH